MPEKTPKGPVRGQTSPAESGNNKSGDLTDGNSSDRAKSPSNLIQVTQISLPKGGGAIKSIDEKFQVNAANGTSSFSIPVPLSPGRNNFMPSLSLSYNSGAGNGPFGIGWSLEAMSIQRKTDKKLPEYQDASDSDTFMFSGAEDLVPFLIKDNAGNWIKQTLSNEGETITRYRPRIEGLFARIEKIEEADNVYWKVRTKDNIVHVFGKTKSAQLISPVAGEEYKISQWNLEYSYDDKGNFLRYNYKKEDAENIQPAVFEKNRFNGITNFTNIYLKSAQYSNAIPYYEGDTLPTNFLFELVFDYGEHDQDKPTTKPIQFWTARKDAFSGYRTGFEIRTHRLCRRLLMFHHFPAELGQEDYLVRSLDLVYEEHPHLTYLEKAVQKGYIWNEDGSLRSQKSLPPLEFSYYKPGFSTEVKEIAKEDLTDSPIGLDNQLYQWIDLYSEGISGILTEQGNGWHYKENLGNGHFTPAKLISPKPSFIGLSDGTLTIQDVEANGKKYVVKAGESLKGYFELTTEDKWESFHPFEKFPNLNFGDPNLKFIDLNGDGIADILISHEHDFIWHASKGKIGYDDYEVAPKSTDEEKGPRVLFSNNDEKMLIALADMSGDGLADILVIQCSELYYYPNLGYGRFGAKVTMEMNGVFDRMDSFNPQFIYLSDIDGSGTTDIVYTGENLITVWFNQSGNSLSTPSQLFNPFPKIDDHTKISMIDLLGNGTSCIVWSSPLPQHRYSPMRYIDLTACKTPDINKAHIKKPHIMCSYKNNLGKEVNLEYQTSTQYYLHDKKEGQPWMTKLPFPVQCVSKVIVVDQVSQTRFASEYSYHHGYYDSGEKEFRGFALVVQKDAETYEHFVEETGAAGTVNAIEKDLFQPPVITKTWFHTGAFLHRDKWLHQQAEEYYPNPLIKTGQLTDPGIIENLKEYVLPEVPTLENLTAEECMECYRALKGLPLRQEVYSEEGDESIRMHPYSVTQHNYEVQLLQPKSDNKHAVFLSHEKETLSFHYERNPLDPRIAHTLQLEIDSFGNVLQAASVVYGRKNVDQELPTEEDQLKQTQQYITYSQNNVTPIIDTLQAYRSPAPYESQTWELNVVALSGRFYKAAELLKLFAAAREIAYEKKTEINDKRKIEHRRSLFLKNDLTGSMPLGLLDTLALPYESYLLAFTPSMLSDLFVDRVDDNLLRNEGRYVPSEGDDNYWIASGKIFYHPNLTANPFNKTINSATAADIQFVKDNL